MDFFCELNHTVVNVSDTSWGDWHSECTFKKKDSGAIGAVAV